MKKVYMKPELLLVLADVDENILAGSPAMVNDPADPELPTLSRDDEDLFADPNDFFSVQNLLK